MSEIQNDIEENPNDIEEPPKYIDPPGGAPPSGGEQPIPKRPKGRPRET